MSSGGQDRKAVAETASALLRQCAEFIERVDDRAYAAGSTTIAGGTLGKHVRHVVDHFAAAVDAASRGSAIDYDHRSRDVPMETDRRAALDAIGSVRAGLDRIGPDLLDEPVRVRVMLTGDGLESELGSTLARELFFATHHAIHHFAMMRAMAGEFGIELDDGFGKAPSTINFERSAR